MTGKVDAKPADIDTLRKWWKWYEESGYNMSKLMKTHKEDVSRPGWQHRINIARRKLKVKKTGKTVREMDITLEQAKHIIKIWEAHKYEVSAMARTLSIPISTLRNRIDRAKMLTKWKKEKQVVQDEGLDAGLVDELYDKIREKVKKGKAKLIITSAQNATQVNKQFYKSLLTYCRHNDAMLVVIPYRYRNPTSFWSKNAQDNDWWADEVLPHALNRRVSLNQNLMILGDIKTQPTATSPLSGFETISHGCSAIIGHPKLELTTIATPANKLPKIITTTGSLTTKNYTPTKAGKKGEHHHTFGACVVEVIGKTFHMRQINATNDGSFMDLNKEYDGEKVKDIENVEALIMGDTHVEVIDPLVVKATFERGSIIDVLKPKTLVWHDLHDFYARNHHHIGKTFINYVKHHTGRDDIRKWLDHTFDFVRKYTPEDVTNVFVYSNHPDALKRWVNFTDPKTDPQNALIWTELYGYMLRESKMGKSGVLVPDPFAWYGRQKLDKENNLFLELQQSFLIKGIEVGYHGDWGPNGTRGSRNSFGKIGTKVVIGHGHSPGIKDGAYQVGTSSLLDLEYVKGPSSWLHCHCIIYPNGKRTLINIIEGRWRS